MKFRRSLCMNNNIAFKTFKEDHLLLLKKWLQEPHVKEFWQETDDDDKLKSKFIEELPKRSVDSFVIYYNHEPIGYIQSYKADKVGNGWWPNADPTTYGIDLFIGEYEMLGKGIGTQVIKNFINKLRENPNVKSIIIDPEPNNLRMIHICEKLGFSNEGPIITPNGHAILLKLIV